MADESALTVAIINSVGIIVVAVIGLTGIIISGRNASRLIEVGKALDGLTTARVGAAEKLGDANAEIARGAGRDEERAKGERIAAALAEGQKSASAAPASPSAPVDVKVVEAAPVDIKASVPIEIKGKKP